MQIDFIYSIIDILLAIWDVLFSKLSSISVVVIKPESSISDVSFFSCAKVIPAFIDSIPIVRAAINVMIK